VDVVGPALRALLAKADDDLRRARRPVGLAVLAPGNNVVWDNCCGDGDGGGQVWARVISVVPLPQGSQACDISHVQVRAALGAVRCMHCLDDEGSPPDPEQMLGDTVAMTKDADSLLGSIRGWSGVDWAVPGARPRGNSLMNWKSLKVETGLPLGPQGCCGGFEWTLTFDTNTVGGLSR
jgi:hypothetical protein